MVFVCVFRRNPDRNDNYGVIWVENRKYNLLQEEQMVMPLNVQIVGGCICSIVNLV